MVTHEKQRRQHSSKAPISHVHAVRDPCLTFKELSFSDRLRLTSRSLHGVVHMGHTHTAVWWDKLFLASILSSSLHLSHLIVLLSIILVPFWSLLCTRSLLEEAAPSVVRHWHSTEHLSSLAVVLSAASSSCSAQHPWLLLQESPDHTRTQLEKQKLTANPKPKSGCAKGNV